jgi:hypothetical protein
LTCTTDNASNNATLLGSLQEAVASLELPIPPTSANSNQSFHLGKTPSNLYQLNRQKEQLQELQNQAFYSSIAEQTLEKVINGCETAMQNAVLLQQENHRLNMENQRQNKKQVPLYSIQEEGSLCQR